MGRAWLGRLQQFPHIQDQEKHHCPVAMRYTTQSSHLLAAQQAKMPGPMPIQEDDATDLIILLLPMHLDSFIVPYLHSGIQ
ncbi:hypothetical protein PAHAL_2G000400 [Panicum hallii]|jgi:hypothetical protein|uniref:Uncharacterized protein n=1 Tax=Panicum hallii TaxID=206008 RepID=A0A2S3GVA5_9POAL|nr:hypothetical protein PAHAL_2G000400 [Panicum hallii]